MAPEDVDGALRYSPLTSVVPVSGGKISFFQEKFLIQLLVLNTLPLPHFTHYFPTRLEVNPEQQQRTQEYFNLMNRDANTPAETNFQRDEFRNTVHLINQIDDRQLYVRNSKRLIVVVSRRRHMQHLSPNHPFNYLSRQIRLALEYLHRQC